MIRFIGIALLCAAATVFLHGTGSAVAKFLPIAGGVLILAFAFSSLGGSVSAIGELASGTAVSEYTGTLIRALGIGYVSELTADVCRTCGAETAGNSILTLGKAELAVLACPLLLKLLGTASSLIS